MERNDDHGPDGPPLRTSAPRRWARRAVLSALTGGGLTAVGLGGALPGGALAAGTSTATGASEETPPPATGTAPTGTPPAKEGGTSEPTTTTSTSTTESSAPPSATSTAPASAAPPPASSPAPAPAPAATPGNGGATGAPKVVALRKQQSAPARRRRRGTTTAGTRGGQANGAAKTTGGTGSGATGTAGAGGAGGPTTLPPGTPNGVAAPPLAVAGQAGTLASVLGSSAVSAQALQYYRIPLFLLPIYQAAGIQYGVPWQILAAINEVETNYGTDLNVSSAGAVGWMQFMPTTWMQYGVDALGAGYADPYNPVDAIFAAARYLHAAGASSDLHTAILAYNHSEAYVSSVLLRAKLIAAYPQSVIATLTGLTEGSLPVAGARVLKGPEVSLPAVANATAGAVPLGPAAAGASANVAATGTSASAAAGASASDAPATSAAGAPASGASAAAPTSLAAAPAPSAVGRKVAGKHSEALRFADLLGPVGAPVLAVQDGRVVKLGHSHKLGNYLALRDVYGDVFTYAGLGSIAPRYHVPAHPASKARHVGPEAAVAAAGTGAASGSAAAAPAGGAKAKHSTHDPAPTTPASAGHQLPKTLHVKTPGQHHGAKVTAEPQPESEGVEESPLTPPPAGMSRPRLYARPNNPIARVAVARAGARGARGDGHGGKWLPLRLGSVVSQGTVLGHLSRTPLPHSAASYPSMGGAETPLEPWAAAGHASVPLGSSSQGEQQAQPGEQQAQRQGTSGASQSGAYGASSATPAASKVGRLSIPVNAQSARLRFAIRPAGDTSTIDPRPILANWRQLDTALHPKGAKSTVDLLGATVAQVFLMSQGELERTVLSDPGISIYECGRQDIASGAIDGRVLAVLEFLSRSGLKPTVSALRCGHSEFTTSGNVSEHYFGDAVDISAINGVPIAGHQGPGTITDVTIRALLTLQGRFVPHQIISLMQYPEDPNTLALPDHWNHIHVGFHPVPGDLAPSVGPGATVGGAGAAGSPPVAAHSAGAGPAAPSPLTVTGDLSPAQWNELVARIGSLQAPLVSPKPSPAAIRDPQAAPGNRDLGARALPGSGGEE